MASLKSKRSKDEKDALTIPIGIELTNRWQLNSNFRLAKYFHRLGVQDSHDMVGIVMATFWDRCIIGLWVYRLRLRG